jgi:hypothetical protein
MPVRRRYAPVNNTRSGNRSRETGCSHAFGSGNATPRRAASYSQAATSVCASPVRPTDSSQRGDSGSQRRTGQTIAAPNPPSRNNHRHPAKPSGCNGTNQRASTPASGVPSEPATHAQARYRPRTRAGNRSAK